MSFTQSLKRALGFRSDDDDYDELIDCPSALPVQPHPHHPVTENCAESEPGNTPPDTKPATDTPHSDKIDFPLNIFDSLLNVFNEAQPDFIRKCLDMDAQRRYLYQCVDDSFKACIQQYRHDAREQAQLEARQQMSRQQQEIEELRRKCSAHASSQEELKQQQLSTSRQRRALNERIQELERQLATAQAEKEQRDLEVKSLLNKLKVAQVHQNDSTGIQPEELHRQLEEATKQISTLNARNAAATMEADNASRRIDRLTEQNKVLTKDLSEAVESRDKAIREKTSMADKLESITLEHKKLAGGNAEISADNARLTNENAALHEEIGRLRDEAAKLRYDASEASSQHAQNAEALQLRIGELSTELSSLKEKYALLENSMQPATPAETLQNIKPENGRRGRPRKQQPKVSAIDETLSETEWLLASPPEGEQISKVSDSDFGYQEPPRKRLPDNDAQMLLF